MTTNKLYYSILRLAIITIIASSLCVTATARKPQTAIKAKYVFYLIGDGMGINQIHATEIYNSTVAGSSGRSYLPFDVFPLRTYVDSRSASSLVTDSSAAGTALATSKKSVNGYMGIDANRNDAINLTEIAHRKGMKTGIVTNVGVNHATPSAFYAHCGARGEYMRIAGQLSKAENVDFIAGSTILLRKSDSLDVNDMIRLFRNNDIVVTQNSREAAATRDKRVVLLSDSLNRKAMRYAIDRTSTEPSVTEFADAAITYLSRECENGFFLMVEGGRIDYACHSNDIATMVHEVNDFSDVVSSALRFAERHPEETLIVVTSDHETGGLALGFRKYCMHFDVLTHQKCSINTLSQRMIHLRDIGRTEWSDMKDLLKESLGFWDYIDISETEEAALKKTFEDSFLANAEKVNDLYASNERMASQSIKLLGRKAHVSWSGSSHTGMQVPLYVYGAGEEYFRDCLDNTDIPKALAKAIGVELK